MIVKNIKLFFKENKVLAIMFILSQIIAVVMILFCYGVFMNVGYEMSDMANRERNYYYNFKSYAGKSKVIAENVKDVFPEILDGYEEPINSVIVSGMAYTEKGRREIRCDFKLKKEKEQLLYDIGDYDANNMAYYVNGDWFTAEDYNNAVKEAIIPYSLRAVSEEVQIIADEEFAVKGYEMEPPNEDGLSGMGESVFMPLESMPDSVWIDYVTIEFNRPLALYEYQELCKRFEEKYGEDIEIPNYNRVDIKDTDSLMSMRYSTIGIGAIAALTVCLVFRFVLIKRSYMTAIYKICGVSSLRVFLMYWAEIVIYLLTNLGIGMLLFFKVLKNILLSKYEWFNVIFNDNGYFRYVGAYLAIVSVMALMIIVLELKRTPYKSLRFIAD